MMKILKKISVTIVVALVTIFLVYGGYTIYAEGDYEFKKVRDSSTMSKYHAEMNDFFNKKFEAAVKILEEKSESENDGKGVNNPKLKSPCLPSDFKEKGSQYCQDKCKAQEDNVSPYCVSIQSLNMYLEYIIHLGSIQGTLDFDSIGWTPMRMTPVTEVLYQEIQNRDSEIDKDIEKSRKVLEATIATYNEFLTAYPIHKQYSHIIKSLIKYKNKLKEIRYKVIQFPSTFIDTTSTKCS